MAVSACILGCAGPRLTPDEAAFFAKAQPWGFILFARNVVDPATLVRLTSDLREAVGRAAPILIDQEGGRVARLGAPHWRDWAPPLDDAERAGDAAERALWLRYRIIAHELHAAGIDVDCAPMADIAMPDTHPFLRNRCYGTDPDRVARLARAVADGLMAGGVLPVLKHVPGHGRGTVDSHLDLPVVKTSADDLAASDFAPFRALADLPLAMTAHVVFTALDPDAPATTSPRMIELMRKDLGLEGLLMTDDISMQALTGDVATRSRAALDAGCDLVLHCNGEMAEMEAVVEVAGAMTPLAARRAGAALDARPAPMPIDIAAAEAEFRSLTTG